MLSVKRIVWSGKLYVEMQNGYRYPKPVVGYRPNKKRATNKIKTSEISEVFTCPHKLGYLQGKSFGFLLAISAAAVLA